ncbi:MAG: protein kinase [Candidatus Aminicenantales bacterium]
MIFKKCPNCEFENPETAKFCNECGAKLEAGESAPAASAPSEIPAGPHLLTPASALVHVETPAVVPEEPSSPAEIPPEPASPEAESPPEDYAIEEPAPHRPFGERFKIIEELGTGNLGTVYRVFDKAMERELALKSIKPEIAEKKDVFEGFNREMKVERGIVHKNIARIFELSAMMETPFITMEYVPGQNLKSVIKGKKRLPVVEAFAVAKHLFNGLAEAHRQGAFHLDLRPDNVMIDKDGTAKIMDLGIARLFRSKGITRVVAGMPQYMSPEQLEGQEADGRSDIYAAGAIFYEMLTGSLPPVGQTPRNPRELNPGIPTELSLLVLKCLEKDKETRYKTAKAVWAELEQMETGISQVPVEPPPPPPTEKPAVPVLEEKVKPAAAQAVSEVLPRPERMKREKRIRPGFSLPRKALVPALLVIAAVIIVTFLWRVIFKSSEGPAPAAAGSTRISLAVLPFEDLDPAKGNEYLGDALAETLTSELRKIDGLLLPDKESSLSFKGINRASRIIGRRLQVDHYLDGNLQAGENKLRVDVKLIQVDTGSILWSGQYEREKEDLLAITDEIGQAIVQTIGVTQPPEQASPLVADKPTSFEAYDAYAQGRFLANKGGKANLEKALEHFDKAAAKESGFALAYEALADAYLQLGDGHFWPPEKAFPKAKEAALKTLLIDPQQAEANVSLARVKTVYEWDFAAAEKGYREALRIEPDCAPAHQSYATLLSALGRHGEAIAEILAAQTLNPQSSAVSAQAGLILYFARLYDQATTEIKKAVATDPLYYGHHYNSALLQIQMGQYKKAILSLRRAAGLGADPIEIELLLAHIYARQEKRAEVGRILTAALKAAKESHVSQVSIATVYAGLNERDQVIACLEIAYSQRESGLLFLKVYPIFDFIRTDPRFVRLLQKIGLVS